MRIVYDVPLSDEDIRGAVRIQLREASTTQSKFADSIMVDRGNLSAFMRGRKPPPKRLIKHFGLRAKIVYVDNRPRRRE